MSAERTCHTPRCATAIRRWRGVEAFLWHDFPHSIHHDVMLNNSGGGAALGLATGRGKVEMVKFLSSKGAKPTSDALQYARTRGHKEIEKILADAGAKE